MPRRIIRLSKKELLGNCPAYFNTWLHLHLYSGQVYLIKPIEISGQKLKGKDSFGHDHQIALNDIYQIDYEI